MSYGEYKFGDFAKLYNVGGPSDSLVGFAEGFAKGFVPAYQAANKAAADEELALAKLDRAAKLDAEKAKTEANSEYEENMKSAKSIVAGVQLPEGVEESAAVLYVFGQLNDAKLTPNQVYTDFTKAIEEGRFNYSDTFTDEPTPPPPAADTPAEPPAEPTQLETEMNEAFGDQSSVVAPEPASTEVSEAPTTEDGSYETASLGTGWAEDYAKRQEDRVNAASETQVAALETQTDVTNPEGLGGGSASVSDVILADADGETTASERVAATRKSRLVINPAAQKKVADEIEIEKIDTYAKALAAYTALIGSGQEDKLNRVKILVRQFAETPDIGSMNLRQLQAFMELTDPDAGVAAEYKSIDPQVMASLRLYAKDFIQDLQNEALPSLSETDPNVLRGVQEDIKSRRLTASPLYRDRLAARIKALDTLAEAKKREDFVLNADFVRTAFYLAREDIYNNPDLDAEAKAAQWKLWQDEEGAALEELLKVGEDEPKPQEANSLNELYTITLQQSEAFEKATPEQRQIMIQEANKSLAGAKSESLTAGGVAKKLAEARINLGSDDPKVVEEAQAYLDAVYPIELAALEEMKGLGATGERDTVAILNDGRRIAVVADGKGGYNNLQGQPVTNISSLTTEAMDDNTRSATTAISGPLDEQSKAMASAVNVALQGYELEKMARQYENVLTRVGGAQAFLSGVRNELESALNIIGEASKDQTLDQRTVIGEVEKFLEGRFTNKQEAAIVKEFIAASTRYIFASGKALGQEGNGFSNQDYNNIRDALLNSNDVESFAANLRNFARERLTEASNKAKALRGKTGTIQAQNYGAVLGNELFTADEYFKMLAEGEPNYPDYMGWAYKKAPIEVERISSSSDTPTAQISETLFGQYVNILKGTPSETTKQSILQALETVLGDPDAAKSELDRIQNAAKPEGQ